MRQAAIFFALLALLSAGAWAQTNIPAGGTEVTWSGNCSESVSFKNDTNRIICDFRIIKTSPSTGTVFPGDIVVEDGIGNWTVDDNEDQSLDNTEIDKEDSTPSSPARVQREPGGGAPRPSAGRCIPKDGTFGITMCGDDASTGGMDENSPLNGFKFMLKPTSESGSDIVAVTTVDNKHTVSLVNEFSIKPVLAYLVHLINDLESCVSSMTVTSQDPDVAIVDVTSEPPGAFDPATGTLTFDNPLALGDVLDLEFTLSSLSAGETTEVEISPAIASTGTDPIPGTYTVDDASEKLVFLGEVMHVGSSPNFWAGGVKTDQEVTYKILDVQEGYFGGSHVVIHHTLLKGSDDMETAEPHVKRSVFMPGNQVWIEANLHLDTTYPELGLHTYSGYRLPGTELKATCLPGLRQAVIGICLEAPLKEELLGSLEEIERTAAGGISSKTLSTLQTTARRVFARSKSVDEQTSRAITQAVDSCAAAYAR